MALPHFFLSKQILEKELNNAIKLELSPEDLHHAQVLRLQPGEHIAVIDASNTYYECEVLQTSGCLEVAIAARKDASKSGTRLVLAQGLPKGSKFDDIVRHATEVGVDEFIPLACKRSIVRLDPKKAEAKGKRWSDIAKSAAMQSGRQCIPFVHMPMTVQDLCSSLDEFDCVIVFWEEASHEQTIAKALECVRGERALEGGYSVLMVIGPEGGLDYLEVESFLESTPFASCATLGPYILRTETAGVVAPALVGYELARFCYAEQ